MAHEIVMPRLSDTMEEGTILRWLKRDGEPVRRGEELVEIETDKASMPYESDQEGTLEVLAQEGQTLPVGAPIAQLHDPDAPAGPSSPAVQASPAPAPPAAPDAQLGGGASEAQPQQAGGSGPPRSPAGERIKASPLARRVASELGLPLSGISGSGPGGRIVKADVEARVGSDAPAQPISSGRHAVTPPQAHPPQPGQQPVAGTPEAAAAAGKPPESGQAAVSTAKGSTTIHPLSRTQQLIARRMAESKATIPHFTLQMDVDMQACAALREQLREHLGGEHPPTYNDMLVKACALALHEHPRVNATYRDGQVELHSRVNVAIAVAVGADTELDSSLVVPTIFDADAKSLGEIARESRLAAERVRAGSITPPELSGATFTISNLGMYGVRAFNAIINPPQAAILAVGAVAAQPVATAGGLDIRPLMTMSLACDHRLLYGADAAIFLARVRELLEAPSALSL